MLRWLTGSRRTAEMRSRPPVDRLSVRFGFHCTTESEKCDSAAIPDSFNLDGAETTATRRTKTNIPEDMLYCAYRWINGYLQKWQFDRQRIKRHSADQPHRSELPK